MASLLDARPAGCAVLFVGDPDQLSPVGHGAPLRDMMAAGVPYGLLTEIRRNSGQIVRTCKAIAEKKRFPVSKGLDPKAGENLVVLDAGTPERQIAILTATLGRIATAGRFNVFDDVQILVAVNEKSPLGRKSLNKHLQGILNPNGERSEPNPFRVGDKIINQTNGFLPAEGEDQPGADDEGRLYVANGELARVVAVAPLFTVAKLANPDRLVRIPRGNGSQGGQEGEEKNDTGCSWELGYAISTHKSQGSEWPIILLMLDSYPGAVRLVDRHWVYTAISRAREMCICIGKASIAEKAVLRSAMWKRKTFLRELIGSLTDANLATSWESDLLELSR
jgi:exodeoxyribonuclease V alpha subunit